MKTEGGSKVDINEFAMQMELDGRNFYLDLAKKTENAGIKSVLTMMAESEAKHYNVILDMQKNDKLNIRRMLRC